MGFFGGGHTTIREDKIANFTVNTAEYGTSVMEILGTTRIGGNVIYYDDFTAHEHRETQRSGKGGGHKTTTITYTYSVAAIVALCEGPISSVLRVWRDKEILHYPDNKIGMTLFIGTENQKPWSYLTGKHPDKALPYKNLAYMAGVLDLGHSGSMPNFNFEVRGKLVETGDGVDVNPADYIQYILNKIGLGNIPFEGLDNYRSYCREADLLISTPSTATKSTQARDIVNEIAELTNAYVYWSNDRFKIVPRADRVAGVWQPNKKIIYNLSNDDFIPQNGVSVVMNRKDSSKLYNRFTVEFLNRDNGYEKEAVNYENVESIKQFGVRQAPTIQAHYIYKKSRAVKIAEEAARRNKYERNKYTFKLDWAFCRLEPGDIVSLTDEALGLKKQAVMIDSVTEDRNGLLTFTAISRAGKDFSPAIYDVHEVDRPFIDFNTPAGNIAPPIIFQPPSELTSLGNELWIGAKGINNNWGGCNVWISDDNEHYKRLGHITNSARMGILIEPLAADSSTAIIKINGQLLDVTTQDAKRGNTLMWLDGECLSYTTAKLLADGNYQLNGIIRGQYNTNAVYHAAKAAIVRCDEALLRSNIRKEDIGKHIWLKFTSVNVFDTNEQELAEVNAYEYTILPYYLPPVTNITAYTRYYNTENAVMYSIQLEWEPPKLSTYAGSQVWYKVDGNAKWQYADSGINSATIPEAVVGSHYEIAICTQDIHGTYLSPDTAPKTTIQVMTRSETPNAPEGVSIVFSDTATVKWELVQNADVLYYEVRSDANKGDVNRGFLGRTNSNTLTVNLSNRQGNIYVFAYGANKKYSLGASTYYSLPLPQQPTQVVIKPLLSGFKLETEALPKQCYGMNIYLEDGISVNKKDFSNTNTYIYNGNPGIYSISVAFVDVIGEGIKSGVKTITVKATISPELLESESIGMDKLDKAAQDVINQASKEVGELSKNVYTKKQTDDAISTGFINFENGKLKSYSTITQMNDAIGLAVKKVDLDGKEILTRINLTDGTISLDGKLTHITGDTLIDNNVIAKGMIQAGAVDATKINVNSLSAISATIGTLRTATSGARMELKDNLIQIFDGNNRLRVKMGVW